MKKKFVAAIAVAALAVSMLGTTAFAAEDTTEKYVDSITFPVDSIQEKYDLGLHIGSYQFGGENPSTTSSGQVLESVLTIDTSAFALEDGTFVLQPATTDATGMTNTMINMMHPVLKIDAANMEFSLERGDNGAVRGFGSITESDGIYTLVYESQEDCNSPEGATTTFDYDADTNTVVFKTGVYLGAVNLNNTDEDGVFHAYTALDDNAAVPAGTYDVDASLKCFVNAMGGVDFGSGLITNATVVVSEDGSKEITLTLAPAELTIFGTTTTVYVDDSTVPVYKATDDTWKEAAYTTKAVPVEESDNSDEGKDDALTSVGKLESGTFAVDISWSPMGAMMSPILDIDAEKMTFNIYNAKAPETSKGSGTITFDEATGVYTMKYTAGVKEENIGTTTTFVYDAEKDTVTFTSKLMYGSASFDSTSEDGKFVTYTAKVTTQTSTDNNTTTNNNAGTSPKTGDTASSAWMIVVCAAAVAVVGVAARRRAVA